MADEQKIGPNGDAFKPVTQVLEAEGSKAYAVGPIYTEILSMAVTPGEVSDIFVQADVTIQPTAADVVDLVLAIDGTAGTPIAVTGSLNTKTAASLSAKKAPVAAGATTVKLLARGTGQTGDVLKAFVLVTVKKT